MTPAEELRSAAKLMRERAEAAEPGPWSMRGSWGPHDDGLMAAARIANDAHDTVLETSAGARHDLVASEGTFEHIASWHPGVALAVAEWLEVVSSTAEWAATRGFNVKGQLEVALKVARAYLGGHEDTQWAQALQFADNQTVIRRTAS